VQSRSRHVMTHHDGFNHHVVTNVQMFAARFGMGMRTNVLHRTASLPGKPRPTVIHDQEENMMGDAIQQPHSTFTNLIDSEFVPHVDDLDLERPMVWRNATFAISADCERSRHFQLKLKFNATALVCCIDAAQNLDATKLDH